MDCRTRDWLMAVPVGLEGAWDKLLNDRKRMEWAMPGGNPRAITASKISLYQYCGYPIQRRQGVPRWPMRFLYALPSHTDVCDWNALNAKTEIRWFKATYAKELKLLHSIFSLPPEVRWGLLYWT